MKKPYNLLSKTERISLIISLRQKRLLLLQQAKKNKTERIKKVSKTNTKMLENLQFKSPILKELFKNMSASAMKKFMK